MGKEGVLGTSTRSQGKVIVNLATVASEPGGTGGIDPPSLKSGGDNPPPHFSGKTAYKKYVTWALITANELQTQLERNTIAFI